MKDLVRCLLLIAAAGICSRAEAVDCEGKWLAMKQATPEELASARTAFEQCLASGKQKAPTQSASAGVADGDALSGAVCAANEGIKLAESLRRRYAATGTIRGQMRAEGYEASKTRYRKAIASLKTKARAMRVKIRACSGRFADLGKCVLNPENECPEGFDSDAATAEFQEAVDPPPIEVD